MVIANSDFEHRKMLSSMISSFRNLRENECTVDKVESLMEEGFDVMVDLDESICSDLKKHGIPYIAVMDECDASRTSPFVHEHVVTLDDGECLLDVVAEVQDYAKRELHEDISGVVSAFAPENALGFVSLDMTSTEDLKKKPSPLK